MLSNAANPPVENGHLPDGNQGSGVLGIGLGIGSTSPPSLPIAKAPEVPVGLVVPENPNDEIVVGGPAAAPPSLNIPEKPMEAANVPIGGGTGVPTDTPPAAAVADPAPAVESSAAIQLRELFEKHRVMYESFRLNRLEGRGLNAPRTSESPQGNGSSNKRSLSLDKKPSSCRPSMERNNSPHGTPNTGRKKNSSPSRSKSAMSSSGRIVKKEEPSTSSQPSTSTCPIPSTSKDAVKQEEVKEEAPQKTEALTPTYDDSVHRQVPSTSQIVPKSPSSPLSASMTPGDDSGEDRAAGPPAQKSDASPSTASFDSSRSASPIRQQSVEQVVTVVAEQALIEDDEVEEPQPAAQPAKKRGRKPNVDKKLPKARGRKGLTEKQKLKRSREAEQARLFEKQEKERKEKAQIVHRQRSLKWYALRLLEFGMNTRDIDEKMKKKVGKYIKKRLNEEDKFLACRIPLTAKFVDEGDYRRCKQFLLDSTIYVDTTARKRVFDDDDSVGTKAKKTSSGRYERMRQPAKPLTTTPHFSLYGDLLVPLDISGKQLLDRTGHRMVNRRNEIWRSESGRKHPFVNPPKPNKEFFKEEMQFYRDMLKSEGNEKMAEAFAKMEGIDKLRLPCPELHVKTQEDVYSDDFKRILLSAPITNVDGFGKALGIDFSMFSAEAVLAQHPELRMDELYQVPQSTNYNYSEKGERTWHTNPENKWVYVKRFTEDYIERKNKALEYFDNFIASDDWPAAEAEICKDLYENRYTYPGDDDSMFWARFGTNLDLASTENFGPQHVEISKFPLFMKPEREGNLIDLPMVGQTIYGVNTVQMYIKPPGARTCAHMENSLMASINWNVGPGTCVWYGVPYEYYGKLKKIIRDHGEGYFSQNYWPNEDELLAAGIPVIKFEQKADQLVYVNTGCFHWVQSNGFCVNVSWNVGQPTFTQLATTMVSFSDDFHGDHQHHFPLTATVWRYAEDGLYKEDEEMFKVIRSILIRSMAYSKMKYDVTVTAGHEIFSREERPQFIHMNRCYQCMQEIFNFVTWYIVPTEINPFLTPEQNRIANEEDAKDRIIKIARGEPVASELDMEFPVKYCAFCDRCAKNMCKDYDVEIEHTMYWTLEEMSAILDEYVRDKPTDAVVAEGDVPAVEDAPIDAAAPIAEPVPVAEPATDN